MNLFELIDIRADKITQSSSSFMEAAAKMQECPKMGYSMCIFHFLVIKFLIQKQFTLISPHTKSHPYSTSSFSMGRV